MRGRQEAKQSKAQHSTARASDWSDRSSCVDGMQQAGSCGMGIGNGIGRKITEVTTGKIQSERGAMARQSNATIVPSTVKARATEQNV